MKKANRIVACLLLALAMLLTAGCGPRDEWEATEKAAGFLSGITEDPQLRSHTEKVLDALIADDYASALDAFYEEVSETEFRQMYMGLQPYLAGIEHYELVPTNINKTVKNGVTTINVRYMMTAGEQKFLVDTARVEGYDGLIAFYLNEYQPVVTTGTLGNMQEANALQWVFLIVGMLEFVFIACVFVDCCRHKMRLKWLWLAVIAVGCTAISLIVTPEQFRLSFNAVSLLNYTSLIRYSTGGFVARIVIPLGAIIYLSMRKSLFAKYAQMQQAADQQTVPPEAVPQSGEMIEPEE